MTPKRNTQPIGACALSTLILAGTARAQSAPAQLPQSDLAHISIHAAPSTALEIVPASGWTGAVPVARCTDSCDFWALPGRYTLYARDHTTGKRQELPFRVEQSARFQLHVRC
ncbi:MAG TPA: hypothetical protein VJV79_33960 [Polyangiaceae bacterium]|nr:hypothetical protein [Polyangiaceae bacterium]